VKRVLVAVSLLACACNPEPAPPNVPGPTVAFPKNAAARAAEVAPPNAKVVAMRHPESRIVSFRIAFAAGSADDPAGREGLTTLAASLMAEGGTQSLTYPQLLDRLFPMAASIGVGVERDETVFEAEVTTDSLAEFYPLLRDVLLAPRMDADGFERVRAKQKSALVDDLRGANDEALGKEALESLLYDGHPYGHPPVGTERAIGAITLDDVRAHRARSFCRERLLIGIAGGFPEGFATKVARDLDSQLPTCGAARAELPAIKPRAGVKVLIVDKPSAESTAISIGFPTSVNRAHPDFPAVMFATDYLGLHRQSAGRLYHELRELRGLNYGDYAYPEYFEQEGWSRYPAPNVVRRQQYMSLWIRPVKPKNGIFALRGALSVYRDLLEAGIAKAEIERFRTFLGRYRGLEQQTESRRLGYAMDDLAYALQKPYLDTLRSGWAALDEAKVKAALEKHFAKGDLSIAIVAKNGNELAKALVKGDPSPPTYDGPKPREVTDYDKRIEKFPLDIKAEDIRVVPVAEVFK
jgi:zinc protease